MSEPSASMRLRKLLRPFRKPAPAGKIHDACAIGAVLNRERDRTDRTGQEFSLVVFECRADNDRHGTLLRFAEDMSRRIRSTDEIGWLADERLAVVMPHTAPHHAWEFVDTVYSSQAREAARLDCIVYSYPNWEFDRDGGGADGGRGNGPATGNAETGRGPNGGEMRRMAADAAYCARPLQELNAILPGGNSAIKRAIDVLGAVAAAILLLPLLGAVALLIKAVSPGPVLFSQERIGYRGRTFLLWKFRTMHVNAGTEIHREYLRNLIRSETSMTKLDNGKDDRIIPFGTLLRASGIDELPQLLNVLRGEMSLIGPRPCLPYEAREYASWHTRRFDVVPGLTGLWQVSGKNRTTFKEMMRLDIRYARARSLALDFRILLKTFPAIVGQVLDSRALASLRGKPGSAPASRR